MLIKMRLNLKTFVFILISIISLKSFSQIITPFSYWSSTANCRSGASNVNDVDNNTYIGFGAGTKTNINWDGVKLVLNNPSLTGTYLSRVYGNYSCTTTYPWLIFSWITTLPFGKELTTTSETATNYSGISANLMTNLIGLWHLNESTTGTVIGAKDFADQSGNGNNVVKTGTITLNATGRFNKGISSNNSGGYVDLTGVNTLISSTGSLTYSVWFNVTSFTNGCSGGGTYLSDRAISGGGNPLAGICIKSNAYNMEVRCDSGAGLAQILGGAVITGTWQHVTIQRDRANNLYRIFVNGIQTGTGADSGCATTLDPFRVGRHATNGTGGLNGFVDEIALWNRALSAVEILQLYRRGANRIKFQIKNCTASDCSDNPTWKGPDNTASTYFTEINNNSIPLTGLGTVQTTSPTMAISNFTGVGPYNNRYFQYQIIFETDNATYTPDIISTTLQH